jgi:hypothetical protein
LYGTIVKKVETASGTTYEVRAGGQVYYCSEDLSTELEMAQPGSIITRSRKRPVGAIVCEVDDKSYVLGGFFRVDDYLCTAFHVVEQMVSNQGTYRYVGFDHKPDRSIINVDRTFEIDVDDFDIEKNLVKTTVPDIFVIRKDPSFWSKLNITQAGYAASHYNQIVTTCGVRDGVLVGATGKTSPNSEDWMLNHRASTVGGFSGFPVFCGNKVVGMHVSGSAENNQLVRIEVILSLIPNKESPLYVFGKILHGKRINGKLAHQKELFGRKALRDSEGYVYFPDEDVKTDIPFYGAEEYIEDIPTSDVYGWYRRRKEHGNPDESPLLTLDQKQSIANSIQDYSFDLVPPAAGPPQWLAESERSKKKKKKRVEPAGDDSDPSFKVVETVGTCMVPRLPISNAESSNYLKQVSERLAVLGYNREAYQWPSISKDAEEESLKLHLKTFSEKVSSVSPEKLKPDPRVVPILEKMLRPAKFEVNKNYRTRESLVSIVNSSQIKDSKSPGYPYCTEGMSNNSDVIRNLGVDGLVSTVLDSWSEKLRCRVFLKGEPHKREKIDKRMLRIIAGFPLHKTVKHIALFESFASKLVRNWLDMPVKFAYSPLVPRSNHHLKDVFRNSSGIWMSDKQNWDFSMLEKYYQYFSETFCALAVRPHDMTLDEFEAFKRDVRESVMEVSKAEYVCSNGKVFKPKYDGIMKSGWFMTIAANSISQLAVHIETMLELGKTENEILKTIIIVGGDDVIQEEVDGVTVDEYMAKSKIIGVPMTIQPTKFDGCEFFSHVLRTSGRSVTATPTRFTKHIENLKRTPKNEVGSSLISLMQEWVWNDSKFEFFHDMYLSLRSRSDNPDEYYPLKNVPNKDMLRRHIDGLEGGRLVQNDCEQLYRTILERREAPIQC